MLWQLATSMPLKENFHQVISPDALIIFLGETSIDFTEIEWSLTKYFLGYDKIKVFFIYFIFVSIQIFVSKKL